VTVRCERPSKRQRSSLVTLPRKQEFAKDLKFKDDSKKKGNKDKKKDDDAKSEATAASEKTDDNLLQQDKPAAASVVPDPKSKVLGLKQVKTPESAQDWVLSTQEKKRQRELKKKQEIGVDLPLSHFYDRKRGIERLINPTEEDNLTRKLENM